MKTLFCKLTLILLSLCVALNLSAQPDDVNYNYSQTVVLILKTDGGGHIFKRPDYDSSMNLFTIQFGIISKYINLMQQEHDGLTLDIKSLPVEETILLFNNVGHKTIYIGDHWIGDGQEFAIMASSDYRRLTGLFSEMRKKRGKPSSESKIQAYVQRIAKLWEEDAEEYYREFYFPEENPAPAPAVSSTDINGTKAAPDLGIEKNNSVSETKVDSQADQKEPETKQTAEEKQKTQVINEAKEVAVSINNSMQQKMQSNPIRREQSADTDLKFWLWILVLMVLMLIGYWWRRRMR